MLPYGQEDWVALRQCLCEAITTPAWNVMYELLGGVTTRVGIKQAGRRVRHLYRAADCHMEHEKFFPCGEEDKATVPREVPEQERPFQAWTVDSALPQQQCCEKNKENIA